MSFLIWARRDSNPRPKDYESSALPLRHRPVALQNLYYQLNTKKSSRYSNNPFHTTNGIIGMLLLSRIM